MTNSEFLKLERQLKGQLLRADRRWFLLREAVVNAAAMALVLMVSDATPWPLFNDGIGERLFFILFWSIGMTWWETSRIRQLQSTDG